jgi:polar amino acid transport system permease protein
MVPPFNNLFIQLLKGSALLTIIAVPEMTNQARNVLMDVYTSQAGLIWTVLLVFYLVLAVLITVGMKFLERRAGRIVGRGPSQATKDRGLLIAAQAGAGLNIPGGTISGGPVP